MSTPENSGGESATAEVISKLESHGLQVTSTEGVRQVEPFLIAPKQAYQINGVETHGFDANLYIYSYSTAAQARSAASQVPLDADKGNTDWGRDVHYFRCKRTILLYFGNSQEILTTLQDICSPPFAFGKTRWPARPAGTQVPADIPSLNAPQRQEVLDLASSDPLVKSILRKRPHHVYEIGAWTTTENKLLGGVVLFAFDKPQKIKSKWVEMSYDCSETHSPPYASNPYDASYTNVKKVTVEVDLIRNRVVAVHPYIDSDLHVVGTVTATRPSVDLSQACHD